MVGLGNLAFVVTVVLLPIVPAYLLYRLLPSRADVEGPLQGLQIKLSGAFAGYFLLVLTLLGFWRFLPAYEVWAVRGQLHFADEQGAFDENLVRFSLQPPRSTISPDGRFEVSVFAFPDQSGNVRLPTLVVEHPGYRPAGVFLDEVEEKSRLTRLVSIQDTIRLLPVPREDGGPDEGHPGEGSDSGGGR